MSFQNGNDFSFIHNPVANQWVISAPKRSKRPDQSNHVASPSICPFCPGREKEEPSLYRVGGRDDDSNWEVRVITNKFPFAPIHEVVVHSPDHNKNFDTLSLGHSEEIIKAYRNRYNFHKEKGNVFIMQNHGEASGESLRHPHSQIVVIPKKVELQIPPIPVHDIIETQATKNFTIFCPLSSQWPDEVWIIPSNAQSRDFGEITDEEVHDFAYALSRLIEILDLRHGKEFPFNFYISPWKNWYLRIIPRQKRLGAFEIGTNVYVNTQDPNETIAFIKEHFEAPNREKILQEHQAEYHRGV